MLSESERALAIREGHRNAADAAYFNERPHLADDNGIRVFDAGFDRGWDAACAERDARIAELEQQLQAYEKHGVTCQTFRHFVNEPCAECNSPGRCAKQLEQQLEEARKDADRYRWLRSVPNGFKAQRIVNDTPKGMDAAIDAAIKDQT